ncbi:MAG: nucleotidyltransferase domain-containing protein, partial [Bacteroidales bacterium]|nr:nucleotidyltransferase domain-containing protein [Bacteroidales bacterium]
MHKTSFDSLRKKLGSPTHFKAIEKFINEVTKNGRVIGVILFGSLAKGEFLPHSDIDILVIYKDRVDFLENNLELRRLDDSGLIEPFGYGYEQLKRMLEEINPFIWDIFEEGLILYAAEEKIIESLKKLR